MKYIPFWQIEIIMKKALFTLSIVLGFIASSLSQNNQARVNTIKNQLEILKIENPGLEEPLNINITQTSLSNFLLAISKIHHLNINVSPQLSSITIINNFSDVSVQDLLIFLVKEYDLDIDFTGNILSISKYKPPVEIPEEKPIQVYYSVADKTIAFDLKNDKLEAVFRKIMDETGKNLLFSPDLANAPLSLYLKEVPLEVGLQKLAESNNLLLKVTTDGFYLFESAYLPETGGNANANTRPRRRNASSFYYKVLDTVNKKVKIDLQNTPIVDVIYTLGEDLKLDIFTASSLENAGTATVKAKEIDFDLLLDKIFESSKSESNSDSKSSFTYKKDGNIYYFGTADQLSLKKVELVTMKHRSVILLGDPSGNGQRRAGRTSINSYNSFQNYNNTNNSRYESNNSTSPSGGGSEKSIDEIIPDDIKQGLDIKIDKELNSFVVNGPGAKVERFKEFINSIDKPVPVILIEVMILEVNRSAITETGISFGIGDKPSQTQGEFFPSGNVTLGATDVNKIIGHFDGFGSFNIGKVVPNFYLDIKAMESAGTLKIKSEPKLTTINGHKAYLSTAETTYYAVTSQNIYGSQIPQTSEIRNYLPIDAELSLTIQPFVAGNGQITLDIQVIQSAFNGERIAEDAPPGITSREFSSIVRMEDQDVVILGGIESVRKDDSGSGVPFLARIPIIKYLFSKRRREATKRELNIVIKPTIIE